LVAGAAAVCAPAGMAHHAVTIRKMAGNSPFGMIFIGIIMILIFRAGKCIKTRQKGKNKFPPSTLPGEGVLGESEPTFIRLD
jgi:hypothetical protein